jgi:chromosome segregation ATPase
MLAAGRHLADTAARLARELDEAEARRVRGPSLAGELAALRAELSETAARLTAILERQAELQRRVGDEVAQLASVATPGGPSTEELGRRMKGVEDWLQLKAEQVDRLEATQHSLRMELFFELRMLLGLLRPHEKLPQIVNQEKHRRMIAEGNLRLNVGAGHSRRTRI